MGFLCYNVVVRLERVTQWYIDFADMLPSQLRFGALPSFQYTSSATKRYSKTPTDNAVKRRSGALVLAKAVSRGASRNLTFALKNGF